MSVLYSALVAGSVYWCSEIHSLTYAFVSEIAKFFGGSTKDGIQFQFRAIKSEADRLRVADAEGQDLSLLINSTPVGTPSRNRGTPVKGTATGSAAKRKQAGAAAAAAAAIATPSKKPRTKKAIPAHMQQVETISSDEESSEQVYDELDFHNTPSKTARAERSTEVATTAATDDYTMSGANGAALPANDFGYTPSTTLSPEDDPVTTPGALQPHFVDPMNLNHVHSSQYIGGSGGGDKQPISIGPGYNSFTTTSASTPGGLSSSYHGSSYTESFPTAQYGTNYSSGSFREPYVHNTESPMISGSESLYETGLA